mmetsp:Transcript_21279/g.37430  ORF Transcript_21279/g.37430 Transcript_21279/m.37430 type:complete len:678 (-) Transcript_21279:222-2255(-)
MLLVCASRSHDKQAMRRMSSSMSSAVDSRSEITLGPLELADIRDLISSILNVPNDDSVIDEDICTHIYQKTGGLPVYVIELLETVKRNKSFFFDAEGMLRLPMKESQLGEECSALVLNQMLNRFDALDAAVRKILHTCAVLGYSFSLLDVARVHPELDFVFVEDTLNLALSEMILVEIGEEDEQSAYSASSNVGSNSKLGSSVDFSRTSSRVHHIEGERNFEFSHDMWRTTVLTTLLEARKMELHRRIATAMEKEQLGGVLERRDLSRLLTLFEHWKSCDEFLKAAPLALMVGARLNEWDLVRQSVDLYRDALEMSLKTVRPVDKKWKSDDEDCWVQVSAESDVLDLIIKLHCRIADTFRMLNRMEKCIKTYQDAYTILSSCSGSRRSLLIPVLAGLCSANLDRDPKNEVQALEQEPLLEQFVKVAQEDGCAIHLARALAMKAGYYAQQGNFEKALDDLKFLQTVYRAEEHTRRITKHYGKDYAMETFSQSILWFVLIGKEAEAVQQGLFVLKHHLPLQDPKDVGSIMSLILPTILVLKLVGRGEDAHYIFCTYVVNAYHDHSPVQTNWVELFNPLIYLLEIVKMEERGSFDSLLLERIQDWILDIENSYYSPEHLRLCHTIMGEISFRLGRSKQVGDPMRGLLFQKARSFLTAIAQDVHSEPFLAHSALSFLRAIG